MISRLGSLLLLLYALGFVLFAFTLGKPARANAEPTDAAVVLPGHGGSTTIGHERRTNPFVLQMLEEDFDFITGFEVGKILEFLARNGPGIQ